MFGIGGLTGVKYFRNIGCTSPELHSLYIETLEKGDSSLFFYILIILCCYADTPFK